MPSPAESNPQDVAAASHAHHASVSLAKPWAALVTVQLLFGSLPAISKFAIAEVSPQVIVICRSLTATLVFALLCAFRGTPASRAALWKRARALPLRFHAQLACLALLGVSVNQSLLFYALQRTTSAAAAILAPNIALFALVISIALGRERFSFAKGANIVLGSAGVLLLFAPHLAGVADARSAVGNLMCTASAFCYASFLALSPPFIARTGPLLFNLLAFLYASVAGILIYFALTGMSPLAVPAQIALTVPTLSRAFWWALAFIVIGATVVTYLLNAYALGRLPPGVVGGLVCSQTVVGVLLSHALVGEDMPFEYFIAMALVLSGVLVLWVSNLRENAQARHRAVVKSG